MKKGGHLAAPVLHYCAVRRRRYRCHSQTNTIKSILVSRFWEGRRWLAGWPFGPTSSGRTGSHILTCSANQGEVGKKVDTRRGEGSVTGNAAVRWLFHDLSQLVTQPDGCPTLGEGAALQKLRPQCRGCGARRGRLAGFFPEHYLKRQVWDLLSSASSRNLKPSFCTRRNV